MKVKHNGIVYISLMIYLTIALLILLSGVDEFYYVKQFPNLFMVVLFAGFFLIYGIFNLFFYIITRSFFMKLFSYFKKGSWIIETILVITVVVAGIALRISYINKYPLALESDYKFYYDTAILIKDGTLTTLSNNEYISLFPHTYGYSYILSLVMRLFGVSINTGLYLNVAFSALTSLFCYGIGRKLAGRVGGGFSLILVAFWPSQILFSNINGAEAAFTFFLFATAYIAVIILDIDIKSSLSSFQMVLLHILSGVLLGVSSAIRPMGLIFLIALVICLLSITRKIKADDVNDLSFRKMFLYKGYLRAIVVILAYFICSQTVTAGVSRAIEKDVASGGAVGYSLMVGLDIKSDGGYSEESMKILYDAYDETLSATKANDVCMVKAIEGIKADPIGILELMSKKLFLVWSNDNYATTSNIVMMNNQGLLTPAREKLFYALGDINQVFYLIVVFLSAIGAFFMLRRDNNGALFAIFFVGTVALFILVEMQNRYHYFALPALAIMAACAMGYTFEEHRSKSLKVQDQANEIHKENQLPKHEPDSSDDDQTKKVMEANTESESIYTIDVKKAIKEGHIKITATQAYQKESLTE